MPDPIAPCIVRFQTDDGEIVGAGFLVSERHVLTCAHVVAQALGVRDDEPNPPDGEVTFDFPLLAPGQTLTGKVVLWLPVRPVGAASRRDGEDIAALELTGEPPPTSQAARLVTSDDLWGHPFRAFGFPGDQDEGVWATGLLRAGQTGGWVQIEDTKTTGYFVAPGFSGGPVWDEQAEGIVGMVVGAERRADVRAAFIIPTAGLVTAWPELAQRAIPPCPYRGLTAFREQDAAFFFGREEFAERLNDAIAARDLVAVVGPSGSGKSSVVQAGLIARLRKRGPPHETWDAVVFTPGERPFHHLAAQLIPLLEPTATETDWQIETKKLGDHLAGGGRLDDVVTRLLRKSGGTGRLLIVVDQFEELFTLTPEGDRAPFVVTLLAALDRSCATLVLTLRADFYGHAIGLSRELSDRLEQGVINLGPMLRDELERAIVEPARRVGLSFEPGLARRILDDVTAEPGSLPLLEFALTELWAGASVGPLTHRAYETIGGVAGAIARRAEAEYTRLPPDQQAVAGPLFTRLVRVAEPDEDEKDTRQRTRLESLAAGEDGAQMRAVVHVLAGARLLVTSRDPTTGEETVEVAHEALIRQWERLRGWLDKDRAFLLWRQRLRTDLENWKRARGAEDALLHGTLLAEGERWLVDRPADLSADERGFIRASVVRRVRLARRRLALAVTVAVVGVLFSLFALLQWSRAEIGRKEAERQQQIATSRQLAANALEQLSTDPELSVLLGMEGVRLSPTTQAEAALRTSMLQSHVRAVISGHLSTVLSAAFSSDGQRVVTASLDRTARVWDGATGQELATLQGHTRSVLSAAFSPDGRRVVTASDDGTARVWDVATGQALAILQDHAGPVLSAAFSPDGQWVVTASLDRTARVWDATSGQVLVILQGHAGPVRSARFSPDGQRVVTAGDDGTARVSEMPNWRPVATLQGHAGPVRSAAFSPDGQRIVTASDDGTARVWETVGGQPVATLQGHTDNVWSAAFSSDGQQVVTASLDRTARVWDATSGRPVASLQGHTDNVPSAAFSPDGQRVVTASSDGTARVWETASGRLVATLQGHANRVWRAAYSPDGTRVVTASDDGTARVWDGASGQAAATLWGHTSDVRDAAFSPDGQRVVTGGLDRTARVWDGATGQALAILQGHTGTVWGATFSPDGTRIVTASDDRTARIWDAAGGPAVATLQGHDSVVWGAAFSPDGRQVATASGDRTARVWETATGRPVATLEGHASVVWSASFSPDGQRVATASSDGTARIWEAASGRTVATLQGHTGNVRSAMFSSDGTRIVTASDDGTARVWETIGWGSVATLHGHTGPVLSASFSPDGKRVATASLDRTGRIWDAASGQVLATLLGHAGPVRSAAFSPDGQHVVTASDGGTARVWDGASGRAMATLQGHLDRVWSAAFSPDGQRVVTASDDGTARIFGCEACATGEELLNRARQHATRGLRPQERERFLP